MKKVISLVLLTLLMTLCQTIFAQVNSGVMPKSAVAQLSESVVPQYDVATPDLNKLQNS